MRRFVPLLVAVVLGATAPAALAQDKPKPQIDFSVAGETFTANQNVPMTGDIDPATQPETVTIHTQRYNRDKERWVTYDKHRVESDSDGGFSFTHPPLRKGRYRARAQVGETADHLAGKNRWKLYRVTARRSH